MNKIKLKNFKVIASNSILILTILVMLYPNLFNLEKIALNNKQYNLSRSKLSNEAVQFIEIHDNYKFDSYLQLLDAIPENLPHDEVVIITSLYGNLYDYQSIHSLLKELLIIGLLLALVSRELMSGRKYRIAHAQEYMSKSIVSLKNYWDAIFVMKEGRIEVNKEAAKVATKESLRYVEQYFSTVTGAPCRACIKMNINLPSTVSANDRDSLIVKTFARSDDAVLNNKDSNNDTVGSNTDYSEIVTNGKRYYHVKNIDKIRNYQNSHINPTSNEKRSKQLGYNTSFVWPISLKKENSDPTIRGYLCVDSKTAGVFNEKYDYEAGAMIASFYYLFLTKYSIIGLEQENAGESNA